MTRSASKMAQSESLRFRHFGAHCAPRHHAKTGLSLQSAFVRFVHSRHVVCWKLFVIRVGYKMPHYAKRGVWPTSCLNVNFSSDGRLLRHKWPRQNSAFSRESGDGCRIEWKKTMRVVRNTTYHLVCEWVWVGVCGFRWRLTRIVSVIGLNDRSGFVGHTYLHIALPYALSAGRRWAARSRRCGVCKWYVYLSFRAFRGHDWFDWK